MTDTCHTILTNTDQLPLTCSRAGACCHGNKVMLNPWELACLARELKISPRQFSELYTEWSGTRLHFGGVVGYNGKQACDQYVEGFGCRVHIARPLACRLFPLGRQIQRGETVYIHQGEAFPCLESCSEVLTLPYCSVEEYLTGQETQKWELAQDAYLELLQGLADTAFELLLDSGLAQSGDTETLSQWRLMGNEHSTELADRIGQKWLAILMVPDLDIDTTNPVLFCQQHFELIQTQLNQELGGVQTYAELHVAAVFVMGLALLLASSLGVNIPTLAEHWITTARSYGAME